MSSSGERPPASRKGGENELHHDGISGWRGKSEREAKENLKSGARLTGAPKIRGEVKNTA